MDLYSRRLPLILIAVLLGILVAQYLLVVPDQRKLIDPETCEIYVYDPAMADQRQYLGEFDAKCMEIRALAP